MAVAVGCNEVPDAAIMPRRRLRRRLRRQRGTGAVMRTMGPVVVVGLLGAFSVPTFEHARLGLVLLLAQSLPLALRSRFPVPVLLITGGAAISQVLLGLPPTNAILGQAVAMATVVARTRWPLSVVPPLVLLAANLTAIWISGVPAPGRHLVIEGTTLAVAWAFGDATVRRAAVDRAVEQAVATRMMTDALRSQIGAASEKMRIARELHGLVGAGLDRIAIQAGAARMRLADPEAIEQVAAIESVGRQVLAELDRFLALLRREPPALEDEFRDPRAELVAVGADTRFPWFQRHLPALAAVAPAAIIAVLAVTDALFAPGEAWPGTFWILVYASAAAVPLMLRRRHPESVAVLVTLASALPLLLGVPVADGVLAVTVAAHAVASYRHRRRASILATASVGLLLVLAAAYDAAYAVQLGGVLVIFTAAAIYVGDTARLARAHDASLARLVQAVEEQGRLRRAAAVCDERARAARELHDSIGHTLSLIVLQAGAARLGLSSDGEVRARAGEALAAIELSTRRALADMDDVLDTELRSPTATVDSMADMLHRLAGGVRATGTPVDITLDQLIDLPRSLQAAVFRVVQEALTNVMKHAPGAPTTVSITRQEDAVRVRVANAPVAERPPPLPSGSRGLAGMQERVALFGGRLVTGPDGHDGFTVDATLPVPESGEAARTGAHS